MESQSRFVARMPGKHQLVSYAAMALLYPVLLMGSGGCGGCGGPAGSVIEEPADPVNVEDGLVNCRCHWTFGEAAIARDESLAEGVHRDIAVCLPEDLNVHLASPDRAAELREMAENDPDAYLGLVEEFCTTTARVHSDAVMAFVQPLACDPPLGLPKQYELSNCKPMSPAGPGRIASFPDPACAVMCEEIECTSSSCPADEVIVTEGDDRGIHFDRCQCTDLPGCDSTGGLGPSSLCHPPMSFPDDFDPEMMVATVGILSTGSHARGTLSRWAANPSEIVIEDSPVNVHVEDCSAPFGICVSDEDTTEVSGSVTLYGSRCRESECKIALEAWLDATDIHISLSLGPINLGSVDLNDMRLVARTEADGVTIDSLGNAVIDPYGLWISATTIRDGETKIIWRGTNESAIRFQVNWDSRTFVMPIDFEEDIVAVTGTLAGAIKEAPLEVFAGTPQIIECDTHEGGNVSLEGSSSSRGVIGFAWWREAVFSGGGIIPNDEPLGPIASLIQPVGTQRYFVVMASAFGGIATDDTVVEVVDTTPPEVELSFTPSILWPPNHKMVEVTPEFEISDECSNTFEIDLVSVVIEPEPSGIGDGNHDPDVEVSEDGRIWLRAERSGGESRTYTLTYRVRDEYGNYTDVAASVHVPASQGEI